MAKKKKKTSNLIMMISGISGVVILSLLLFVFITGKNSGTSENTSSEAQWVLPTRAKLEFTRVLQNPELPTGCEITALTAVLNFYGYDVDKMYMAKNYLELGTLYKDSFSAKFIGEPWDEEGYGCYAPVIFDSASKYLNDMKSELNVYNISGSDMTVLFAEVSKGHPVLVWTNMDLNESPTVKEIKLENGNIERWIVPEHCVVLTGYDYDKGSVCISDPLGRFEEIDMDKFNKRYVEHMSQALVIK